MASTRTLYALDQPPSWLAVWSSRIAMFCVVLLAVTAILHRLYVLPTAIGLNIAAASFFGAGLALLMASIAGLDIWVTGRQGAPRVIVGGALALGLLAIPVALLASAKKWAPINDVTTDTANPPALRISQAQRGANANAVAYPGEVFARKQTAAYPDLKTLEVPRTAEDAFEQVIQALGKMHLKPSITEAPSSADGKAGHLELTDYTLLLGFADDVAIRVAPGPDDTSFVDIRSSSRYGEYDFGHNAERVREIMREIVGRLEASIPSIDAIKAKASKKPTSATKQPERDRGAREDRKRPRPAQ